MARRSAGPSEGDDFEWQQLSRDFPNRAKDEALYALPAGLVERIRREAPKLFTPEDIAFETALNANGRTGFFLRQPFRYPLLTETVDRAGEIDEEQDRLDQEHRRLTEQLVRDVGGGAQEINDLFRMRHRLDEEVSLRRRAFAGWLVTEAGFHLTRGQFHADWKSDFERRWRYSLIPIEPLDRKPDHVSKKDFPFFSQYLEFAQKWNISELLTWDLPVPIAPGIVNPTLHSSYRLGDTGCQFFVPWYLARDEKLTLFDLMGPQALETQLNHLRPWLERTDRNFSLERFAVMLPLYVYLELALKQRYGLSRLRGHMPALDRALGQFIKKIGADSPKAYTVEDTIKKIRMRMQKRLKACADALPRRRSRR